MLHPGLSPGLARLDQKKIHRCRPGGSSALTGLKLADLQTTPSRSFARAARSGRSIRCARFSCFGESCGKVVKKMPSGGRALSVPFRDGGDIEALIAPPHQLLPEGLAVELALPLLHATAEVIGTAKTGVRQLLRGRCRDFDVIGVLRTSGEAACGASASRSFQRPRLASWFKLPVRSMGRGHRFRIPSGRITAADACAVGDRKRS